MEENDQENCLISSDGSQSEHGMRSRVPSGTRKYLTYMARTWPVLEQGRTIKGLDWAKERREHVNIAIRTDNKTAVTIRGQPKQLRSRLKN